MAEVRFYLYDSDDSSVFDLLPQFFPGWFYLPLELLFCLLFYSLAILIGQLLNLNKLCLSLLFKHFEITLKLRLYFFLCFPLLIFVRFKNFVPQAVAVFDDFLSTKKVFSGFFEFLFSFLNLLCIWLFNFLDFLLDLLNDISLRDV
jgi:hypothetical protein